MTQTANASLQAGQLIDAIARSVIGKRDIIQLVVTAFIAGGHILLEDIPGTGKTLLAKALARSFHGHFKRIQFTSDLMPSDITGASIFNPQKGAFEFAPGPIFSHIILADEINRATPRAQSSLLEVMEEQQVTVDGVTHTLDKPFFVIATQNPLEFHGTFPLPESQLDRFILSISMGYPSTEVEQQILMLHRQNTLDTRTTSLEFQLEPIVNPEDVLAMTRQAREVEITDEVIQYIIRLIQQTRNHPRIALGASIRASVAMLRVAQTHALIEGRNFVIPDDVKYLAPYLLVHRVALNYEAARKERLQFVQELVDTVAI